MHPSLLKPALFTAKAPAVFKAKFTTTAGDFVVEVHRDWAPLGADRFYNLVRGGYFTNAAFFRVVQGFVVQFGLSADPKVNKVWSVANIKDDPVVQSNKRGSLVFATAGPIRGPRNCLSIMRTIRAWTGWGLRRSGRLWKAWRWWTRFSLGTGKRLNRIRSRRRATLI